MCASLNCLLLSIFSQVKVVVESGCMAVKNHTNILLGLGGNSGYSTFFKDSLKVENLLFLYKP